MVAGVASLVTTAGTGDPQPKNVPQAAEQFEALLLAQMLKGAHDESSGGWLGTGDDQAGSSMVELAEEHLAQVMASRGGLGLAGLIAGGLKRADAAGGAGTGTLSRSQNSNGSVASR
jgi:Rod binding domain-containing protein